jgi:CAAX prenyl protease-like protein
MAASAGHGWWPYLGPLFSFLLVLEAAARAPQELRGLFLVLQVALPAGFFLFFWRRGAYPELAGYPDRSGALALDLLVGVAGAVLWMAPYVLLEWAKPAFWGSWPGWLRPDPADAFDPNWLGPAFATAALTLRAVGYGLVTPFVEEIFVRSFLARYAEVFDRGTDFRALPIARFGWRSFWVVVIFFTLSHVPWEWPVALLWIVGTQLWFYHRKQLGALVAVHAASNLAIFFAAWASAGRLTDRAGAPFDLWFFL